MNSVWRRLKLGWGRRVSQGFGERSLMAGPSHSSYPPSNIDFAFHRYIPKRLCSKLGFPQCSGAARNRARGRSLGEDAVDTRFAHFVVAFWVDFKAHVGVEIAGGFADGADVCGGWRKEQISRCWWAEAKGLHSGLNLTIFFTCLSRSSTITGGRS